MKLIQSLLVLAVTFSLIHPALAAASFNLSSSSTNLQVGQNFSVQVRISGANNADTARIVLTYPNSLVQAQNVVLNGPLASASPGNSINNAGGQLSWGGFSVDNPVSGSANFARVTFRVLAEGTATISVGPGSRIISNGEEQSSIGASNTVRVNIGALATPAPQPGRGVSLSSPTHPNSESWYATSEAEFKWTAQGPVSNYFIAFDQEEGTNPTDRHGETSKKYTKIKDGIWYFHLKTDFSDNSEDIKHYKVQIDTKKPNPFEPFFEVGEDQKLMLHFATTDDLSGVSKYQLQINSEPFADATSPAILQGLLKGENLLTVRALDFAGNAQDGWIKFVINEDGSITELDRSRGVVCNLGIWPIKGAEFCKNPLLWHIFGYLLLLLGLWAIFRIAKSLKLV